MRLARNIYKPLLMTWLDLGGQMPKVKVTAGSRGDEGIHLLFQLENAVY